jgi:DNA repair protein RadA/Sms
VSKDDVYVSTVGGVRLVEPGADLAIAIAIATAKSERAVRHDVAAIGELSLSGEIRPVTQAAQRRHEASRLGYKTVIDERTSSIGSALQLVKATAMAPAADGDIPEF